MSSQWKTDLPHTLGAGCLEEGVLCGMDGVEGFSTS